LSKADEKPTWYMTTGVKSGSTPIILLSTSMRNMGNSVKGRLLAEPFPGTMAQGVVLVIAKEFSGL
jgi:hypothetical protein